MKTLYVLRHAKSSWDDPNLDDRDRPLSPRGLRAAAKLVEHVKRARVQPDLVLCSPALRACATLELLRTVMGDDLAVRLDEALYGASGEELIEVLRGVGDDVQRLMVVGHNPGLQELVELLAEAGRDGCLSDVHAKFPTGALATVDLGSASWRMVGPCQGYLVDFVVPKSLP